jgi:hypothetical protein
MRDVLAMHERDARLQDAKALGTVGSLYFPFIITVLNPLMTPFYLLFLSQ